MDPLIEAEIRKLSLRDRVALFCRAAGPGVITGAADDDPSGICTYTIAGAQFGPAFLWTAFLTWPLMASVQMACAHLAMVTGEGLAAALAKRFPRYILVSVCVSLFLANTLNVGADLVAMADCSEMLTGLTSHYFVPFFGVVLALATIRLRYSQIAALLKWLVLSLFAYVIVAIIQKPDWYSVLVASISPRIPDRGGWGMFVAILGTTISPYLFFWQSSQEIEEKKAAGSKTLRSRRGATPMKIFERRIDVGLGTFFSNLVMFFIILSASLTLHRHGLFNITTSREAAEALEPLAGRFSAMLYTFGLLGVGLLAIPTLTGSAAYAFAETFRWRQGLDASWMRARAFYAVIICSSVIGIFMDFVHFNPIKALYWSAVINGLLAPFLLAGIFIVIRDRKIMYGQTAPRLRQALLFITMVMMFGAGIAMFVL